MSLRAAETIKKYNMLGGCRSVVAGVSGGADSMALLHFLCSLREEYGITVYAAHVNHGLRGEESLRDERHVEKACGLWNVKLFVLRADVRRQSGETGESVEQCGRRIRYGFFERLARENDARIATAHTLSDCMETVFINMARGTGLRGLCGIPPVRGRVIRPLIADSRRDTEEYCALHSIEYVTDSTNFSKEYTRNRIRMDVMPVFYGINPSFDRSAKRMMNNLTEDEKFLAGLAKLKLGEASEDGGFYNAALLAGLDPPILARAVAQAISLSGAPEPESSQIDGVAALLKAGAGTAQLKGGWFARAAGHRLYFIPPGRKNGADPFRFPLKIGVYRNRFYEIRIETVEIDENCFKKFNKRYLKNMVDCDKIKGNTVIRGRKEGEGYRPAGRNGYKTFKKLLNEKGVPAESRSSLPCAADEDGVLWAYGFGPDERCRVSGETKRAFVFNIKNLEVVDSGRRYPGSIDSGRKTESENSGAWQKDQ